jgi:hypothetical protein
MESRSSEANPEEEAAWECGWDSHARAQRRRWARLSLIEKIRWLEEAQQIVQRFEAQRSSRRQPPPLPDVPPG